MIRSVPAAPDAPRVVLIVAPDPAQELDVSGPTAVFGQANRLSGRPGAAYQIRIASVADDAIVRTESGIRLLADAPFHRIAEQLPGPVDTLLIAGGAGHAAAAGNAALIHWLRELAPTVRRVGAVCTGAFVLASTGLLDAKRATTHWQHASKLARRYPRVQVDPNPIWIEDGGIYTSAGVTSGMDLSLALVEDDLGHATSLAVARELVLFLRRPGSQAQFSSALQAQAAQSPGLRELQGWIADHLDGDLSVNALAERLSMSPRNFARVFARQVGLTPARYVEIQRLEAARRMLEQSERRLDAVARLAGFSSADAMRQVFLRHLQTTPERYRAAFRAQGSRAAANSPAGLAA
ncbi:GlxA family transcriptional regulator [Cupriavidus sp. AU9028]|uniref:GlxA family transcriptional regulator n=1 Tax=Cupriavidus sp. AU9028 TaxID=2871157 RepID=UPI001C96B05C|nr:DJ-1/PfpI family protein [Cupriavidus sp. AU9028]MBY4899239.1 DJ-1/PfpI family protein [Cupriavidus sp. AU9028]